jgi:hypothetical protein
MDGPRPEPTPCIHVCELDAQSRLCRGCHRSAEEICAWPGGSGSAYGGEGPGLKPPRAL